MCKLRSMVTITCIIGLNTIFLTWISVMEVCLHKQPWVVAELRRWCESSHFSQCRLSPIDTMLLKNWALKNFIVLVNGLVYTRQDLNFVLISKISVSWGRQVHPSSPSFLILLEVLGHWSTSKIRGRDSESIVINMSVNINIKSFVFT